MTDKQIIINGVDVSGCSCIENGYCLWVKKYYETGLTPKCEQVKDCYYKQHKRSEAQCEAMFVTHTDLEKKYKAKEQEYELLKNLFKGVQKSLEVEIEACSKWSRLETEARFELVKTQEQLDQLNEDRIEALKQLEFVRTLNTVQEAEIRKLSKTFTEIKEIAQAHKKDESVWNPYRQLDKILQKISEVENG